MHIVPIIHSQSNAAVREIPEYNLLKVLRGPKHQPNRKIILPSTNLPSHTLITPYLFHHLRMSLLRIQFSEPKMIIWRNNYIVNIKMYLCSRRMISTPQPSLHLRIRPTGTLFMRSYTFLIGICRKLWWKWIVFPGQILNSMKKIKNYNYKSNNSKSYTRKMKNTWRS